MQEHKPDPLDWSDAANRPAPGDLPAVEQTTSPPPASAPGSARSDSPDKPTRRANQLTGPEMLMGAGALVFAVSTLLPWFKVTGPRGDTITQGLFGNLGVPFALAAVVVCIAVGLHAVAP